MLKSLDRAAHRMSAPAHHQVEIVGTELIAKFRLPELGIVYQLLHGIFALDGSLVLGVALARVLEEVMQRHLQSVPHVLHVGVGPQIATAVYVRIGEYVFGEAVCKMEVVLRTWKTK